MQREHALTEALSTAIGLVPGDAALALALDVERVAHPARHAALLARLAEMPRRGPRRAFRRSDLEKLLQLAGERALHAIIRRVLREAARGKKAVQARRKRLPGAITLPLGAGDAPSDGGPTSLARPEVLDRVLAARPSPGPACRDAGWACPVCGLVTHDPARAPRGACLGERDCQPAPLPAGCLHRHCDRCGVGQAVVDDHARRTCGSGTPIWFETSVLAHRHEARAGITSAAVGWVCARCDVQAAFG